MSVKKKDTSLAAVPKQAEPNVEINKDTSDSIDSPKTVLVKKEHFKYAQHICNKINERPDVLKRNENNEVVLNGKAVPGSNFTALFGSLFSVEQEDVSSDPGLKSFLDRVISTGCKTQIYC